MGRVGFAARVTDPTAHLMTPLGVGPGSPNVLIGFLPAWRGLPAAAAAALQAQKDVSDAAVKTAQAATIAAAGTPGAPAAKAAEETAKGVAAAAMATAISAAVGASATSGGAPDIHTCPVPMGLVPHGPGVVIDGSKTVLINGLPACRVGDSILEALGPPNKIVMGHMKTFIGEGTATKSSGGGSRDLPKQSNNSPGGGASGAAGAGPVHIREEQGGRDREDQEQQVRPDRGRQEGHQEDRGARRGREDQVDRDGREHARRVGRRRDPRQQPV